MDNIDKMLVTIGYLILKWFVSPFNNCIFRLIRLKWFTFVNLLHDDVCQIIIKFQILRRKRIFMA